MGLKRKLYLVAFILSAAAWTCSLGDSYLRYITQVEGGANVGVAKWKVALQGGGEELNRTFHIAFQPASGAEGTKLVGGNKFAPGVSREAELLLDLTGTEVAADYNITVDKQELESRIGSGSLELKVSDSSGNDVRLGQDTYIPLSQITGGMGKHIFKFYLTWKNDSTGGRNSRDTDLALSGDTLTLPVRIKIKQHIGDAGGGGAERKVVSNISYIETMEMVTRATNLVGYTFAEQDALSANPEKGFYSTSKIFLNESGRKDGYYAKESGTSRLLFLRVDLSAFSGSMNGTGRDKELTAAAINALRTVLGEIKQNNNTVILRFVYDNDATGILTGVEKVEPSQDILLKHIGKLAPVFKEYSATINVIQIGMYGLWGEAYYNTDVNSHPEYYRQTVSALLDATKGTDITIAVRTPKYYTWYKGSDIADIDSDITTSGDPAYRVGVFNDGYGGSEDDLGTYVDREKETSWLKHQASHTYFGGEAIIDESPGAVEGVGRWNTSGYFIPEAFRCHTSYLNWEWNQALHKKWAEQMYIGSDSRYQGKKALTYIENHLGYRFVVREVKTYETAGSGESLPIDITVNNVGFGNLIKRKQADIVITDSTGSIVKTYSDVSIDARDFLSQTTIKKSIAVTLPALSAGKEYRVYLRISSGETLADGSWYSAIRFANSDIYSSALQANYIACFKAQ